MTQRFKQDMGAQRLEAMVIMGSTVSPKTYYGCSQNHQRTFVGNFECDCIESSNGPAEGINSRIKMIKVRSRGFRNKERFANAIYFHLGGLDLYPDGVTR